MRSSFETHGHFDEVIKTLPQLNGAKKLVIVTHGFNEDPLYMKKCEDERLSTVADNIRNNDPENTATISLCWNSRSLPEWPKFKVEGKLCALG